MQVDNRILDDLVRVAGGAIGALAGLRGEVEGQIRQQFERILAQMDVVPRDEFEAMKAVATAARAGQEDLERRVALLEATLATFAESRPSAPKRAVRAKSSTESPD